MMPANHICHFSFVFHGYLASFQKVHSPALFLFSTTYNSYPSIDIADQYIILHYIFPRSSQVLKFRTPTCETSRSFVLSPILQVSSSAASFPLHIILPTL